MKENLQEIFRNINDWLRFAEAKNAVIIALNGAAIWGIIQNLETLKEYVDSIQYFGIFLGASAFVGLIIAMCSFLPSINIYWEEKSNFKKINIESLSLYYFGHIKNFERSDYLKSIYKAEGLNVPDKLPRMELDLSHQIIQNARITWIKYQLFLWAVSITLVGMVLPIPFLIGRFIYIKLKKSIRF